MQVINPTVNSKWNFGKVEEILWLSINEVMPTPPPLSPTLIPTFNPTHLPTVFPSPSPSPYPSPSPSPNNSIPVGPITLIPLPNVSISLLMNGYNNNHFNLKKKNQIINIIYFLEILFFRFQIRFLMWQVLIA